MAPEGKEKGGQIKATQTSRKKIITLVEQQYGPLQAKGMVAVARKTVKVGVSSYSFDKVIEEW